MAHENKVLQSIETPDGMRCVDVFVRPDGTFGFEEYRREMEDARGWYPVGFYGEDVFESADAALEKAMESVPWLREAAGEE